MAATTFLPALESAPHTFLQPTLPLYTDAVAYLKNILDPLAQDISSEQQQRLKDARKKRKRGEGGDEEVLRLKQIHTDGFGVEQVWEQARRVIDAATDEVEREFEKLQAQRRLEEREAEFEDAQSVDGEDEEDLGEEGVDFEVEGVDDGEEEYHSEEDDDDQQELDLDGDMHDDFDEMEEDEDDEEREDEPAAEFVEDKFGLNDGFFSIDDFNRQSEFLEQQDTRGEDDAADDDDEIDFDADPTAQASAGAKGDSGEDAEESEDEEDGPTFGDPDAESEEEDEDGEGVGDMDGMGGMGNTNSVMYAEFFAPPAQKKRKNKKGRPNPHNFPEASASKATNGTAQDEWAEPEDMKRTMDAVHRDLFDESDEEDEEPEEQLDPADPRARRSAHERRKLQLQEEIRKLEAANVAKRDWQLSGEARAADRPVNALLEEDLDFERAGKPVPVITAEISEDIESLIKRRILAFDFQDIIKRRPDDLATGNGKRGKLDFELEDTKSKKGLAEEYEEEYSRRTDPNFVDVKDEKLAKEQKEIEALWKEVCGQLDSLASWNFRPKAAAPQMDIRVDAPAITMEDARPSAGGEIAGASQLAPQEVYKGGEGSKTDKAEVVGKSGLPAGREELDKDERKRRRRREKERIRKASGNDETADGRPKESRAKKEKKNMLGDLKKGGVKVIGKKGVVTDVEGNEARDSTGGQGAGRYKL
ncbi:Putative U3 small nucleolar ribonucleoprotein complex, subunit Mpp10 [Septoria linicola]|uniref:U3 small nucleolar ribonucleoprotein protein MPP10 n=1 Tax=Septoria linicola TaxID=215465 RepID=A0A9Q9AZL6_9PEZI|nr:putative U3 small nucleolar ribonucleoprotein complex, subunit Mpp10 [Septoria linicola]USW58294.1 Putative U3 small nucleolar ribonucleoprotein complex, subunit Mpp10 [Septoria linicola]